MISAPPPSLPRWIWAFALLTDLATQGRSAEARFHRDKLEGAQEFEEFKGDGMIPVGDLLCDLCVSVFQKFCRSKLSAQLIAVNAKFETCRTKVEMASGWPR